MLSSPARPTILLLGGAWYPPSAFSSLTSSLSRSGFETICPQLPSIQSIAPFTADCAADTKYLHEKYLSPLIETDGKDVMIVAHSDGAIPGSAAAAGLSKESRMRQGKAGGVVGLDFLSAFIVKENGSMSEMLGGQWPPFIAKDTPSPGLCTITTPTPVLFPDAPPTIANETALSMLPQAMLAFESPVQKPVWVEPGFACRCLYARCLDEGILPVALYDVFIATIGEGMEVKDMQTGHSPFLSDPEGVASVVAGHVEKVMGMNGGG